jgi:hypothetical protein
MSPRRVSCATLSVPDFIVFSLYMQCVILHVQGDWLPFTCTDVISDVVSDGMSGEAVVCRKVPHVRSLSEKPDRRAGKVIRSDDDHDDDGSPPLSPWPLPFASGPSPLAAVGAIARAHELHTRQFRLIIINC